MRSLSDMSPMIRRKGSGSCLISVGAAMSGSPFASTGCWWMSITYSSYRLCRGSSQIVSRFSMTRVEQASPGDVEPQE